MIVQATPDQAAKIWHVVEPMLAPAIAHTSGCYESADVLRAILNHENQLWVAYDEETKALQAAITTSVQRYPRKRTLRVEFIGGSHMRSWANDLIAAFDAYSRVNKIDLQEGYFREGWERIWTGCKRHGVGFFREVPA